MIKTAVVILNWNGKHFLEQFLSGVIQHSVNDETVVYVADNGSSDGSVAWLQSSMPHVPLILFDKNFGFTGGYNKALSQIQAKYYVLLNSDIEVTQGWLAPMVAFLDNHAQCAAVMPKMLDYNHRGFFEYAGACGGYIDHLGYPFCRGRMLSVIEEDQGQYNHPVRVFWATGACLCIRAELFHSLDGFDEAFFAHMEEIDLCWRLQDKGHEIWVIPASEVYHVGGGALPNNSPGKLYLNYRNNMLMLYKNLPTAMKWRIISLRLLLDWLSAFVYLLKMEFGFFAAVFKAHTHFFKMLRAYNLHDKRQSQRFFSLPVYKRSILWDFFVLKRKKFSHLPAEQKIF